MKCVYCNHELGSKARLLLKLQKAPPHITCPNCGNGLIKIKQFRVFVVAIVLIAMLCVKVSVFYVYDYSFIKWFGFAIFTSMCLAFLVGYLFIPLVDSPNYTPPPTKSLIENVIAQMPFVGGYSLFLMLLLFSKSVVAALVFGVAGIVCLIVYFKYK